MKRLACYHVHSDWCDGTVPARKMVEEAISSGITDLGFTAHAAWPVATHWHLPMADYEGYIQDISSLSAEFKDKINILCGFEADWLPGVSIPDHQLYAQFKPDLLIGSVHYITNDRHPECGLCTVDGPAEEIAADIKRCFQNNTKKAVCEYWHAVRQMISSCDFDIIGHLDVIRKRNAALNLFDETEQWYRRELKETARSAARSGKIVEINTGGMVRAGLESPYPSADLLHMLAKKQVPITICPDAHSPADLLFGRSEAVAAAKAAGYKEQWIKEDSEWISVCLD